MPAFDCVESEKLRNLLPLSGFDDATEDRLIFSTVSTRAEFCSDRLLISKSFSTSFVSAKVRRFLKQGQNKLNFSLFLHKNRTLAESYTFNIPWFETLVWFWGWCCTLCSLSRPAFFNAIFPLYLYIESLCSLVVAANFLRGKLSFRRCFSINLDLIRHKSFR